MLDVCGIIRIRTANDTGYVCILDSLCC